MKHQQAAEQPTKRGSSESFTGTAWQQTVAVDATANPLHVARVTFEPGARTVWHTHPRGQILTAISGTGRFQIEGGRVLALNPGDSLTVAPGEKRWHGAAPDQLLIEMFIQAADTDGEQATWLHPVSDEEYHWPAKDAARA